MRSFLHAFRRLSVTYCVSDLVAVSLIAALVAVWAAIAGGSTSLSALLACQAVFFAFYLVGSLLAGCKALSAGILFDLPLRLLTGYIIINTLLLALAWLSPLGIVTNFAILVAMALVLVFASQVERHELPNSASLWVVGICLVATTLWCQDSIRPISEQGNIVLVKPWVDGFYHAVHIRIFGASHGASSIDDFRLAGVPARLYHYGVYLTPALIKQVSGIHSYTAFAGILAPVGVFFTGLAAYAFFGSLWGAWPGVAAAAALLLLPDGTQQGISNTFMSYHWLTQISPSATFGLALAAVAWLFVIRGCGQGNRLQLVVGWVVSGILLFYKLHYLIASALLLLVIPPLCFNGKLGFGKRTLWTAGAGVAYVAGVVCGQKVPGVPLIRFDGSSTGEILRLVQSFARPGPLRDVLARHIGPNFPRSTNVLLGAPYILSAIFGLGLALLIVLVIALRRRTETIVVLFPILLIVNFVAMFFGLALDFERSTPDELSHRPLMLMYFFVVAWIGGALGLALFESRRMSRIARPVLLCVVALLMVVPAHFGPGVQLMWAMPRVSPVRVPLPLVRIAEYIRQNGSPQDVFQDSAFDRTYTIAALSERRTFVAHTMTAVPFRSDMVDTRTAAIDRFMGLRLPKLVRATAGALGFRWFLLEPGDRVDWPGEIVNDPAFTVGPYRLYKF